MESTALSVPLLMRRLAECPPDLLEADLKKDFVPLAVIQDVFFHLGGGALSADMRKSIDNQIKHSAEELRFGLLMGFLLMDPVFKDRKDCLSGVEALLRTGLMSLGSVAKARDFVASTERREELGRLLIAAVGLLPQGESKAEAKSRWESLDTVRRLELMHQAAAMRKRQEELRKAKERKAAEEAASKWSRE